MNNYEFSQPTGESRKVTYQEQEYAILYLILLEWQIIFTDVWV